MNDSEDNRPSPTDGAKPGKKAYERPQVIYRAPLEAMASVCAPAPPSKSNPGLCPLGPISS